MRVEPDLLTHPKYIWLKTIIGPESLEYLFRLWSHCQLSQRGGEWPRADAAYVEAVCQWHGEPSKLFNTFIQLRFIDRKSKGVIIHDWNEMNSRAVTNWGLGNRTKRKQSQPEAQASTNPGPGLSQPEAQASTNPGPGLSQPEAQAASTAKPYERVSERVSEGRAHGPPTSLEAVIPTLEEVLDFCAGGAGIPPAFGKEFWHWREEHPGTWLSRGHLIFWRRMLKRQWEERRATWRPLVLNGSVRQSQSDLFDLKSRRQCEVDKKKRHELDDQIEALEAELKARR